MLLVVRVEGHRELEQIMASNDLKLIDDLQLESGFLTRAKISKLERQCLFLLL